MRKSAASANKIKRSPGEKMFDAINFVVFGLFALICIYPFYYILICTFSNTQAVSNGDVLLWPVGFNWMNYREVLELQYVGRNLFNSVARVVIGTTLSLFCTSFLGYAMSRRELWHRKIWYRMITITMYLSAGMIPTYLNIKSLGLGDNFWVYILPGLISPFNLMLFKTYVESIPSSLEESAQIDGAGYITRYLRVVMPLSKPILATLMIFTAVGHWNSFMDSILYIRDLKLYTMSARLRMVLNEAAQLADEIKAGTADDGAYLQITPMSVRFTIAAITTIPVLCIYPFFQKYFTGGIMIGAVKG